MSVQKHNLNSDSDPSQKLYLPFALPIIQAKKLKKKCCKKYKKGKRCKRCPNS